MWVPGSNRDFPYHPNETFQRLKPEAQSAKPEEQKPKPEAQSSKPEEQKPKSEAQGSKPDFECHLLHRNYVESLFVYQLVEAIVRQPTTSSST